MPSQVKFTRFRNDSKEALALDQIGFDSETNKLSIYSSVNPSIKEEVQLPEQVIDTELDGTSSNPVENMAITEAIDDLNNNISANVESSMTATKAYTIGEYLIANSQLYRVTSNIANGGTITVGTNVMAISVGDELGDIKGILEKYDDVQRIIKITNAATTLGDVNTILGEVNTDGDHIFFDVSSLGLQMYLCTIFINTDENIYKIVDLVKGRVAEGAYDSSLLLEIAIAQASDLATQSQIDYLQDEIDELSGATVFKDYEALGNAILNGTSEQLITEGDSIDINWIANVRGTTSSGNTVTCTDPDTFINGMGECEAKTYYFIYDGTNWTLDGETVSLSDYAITVSGTYTTGEVLTIVTSVTSVSYTFTSYDTAKASDSDVPHNWLLEQTYAPSTKVYDTYEALFSVYAGKTVPVGNYHLADYSYRSGFVVDIYLNVTSAIGSNSGMVQVRSNGYTQKDVTNASNVTKTGVNVISGLTPTVYGTRTNASGAVTIAYAATSGVTYTELTALNTNANDPVVYTSYGVFDKCALGSNTWAYANLNKWLNDDTAAKSVGTPSYPLDIVSPYNLNAGFLYGIDPRAKALIQYCSVRWTSGCGNAAEVGAYAIATGTCPASNAPTYYEKSGTVGAWTYTALDPQPSSGDSVEGYYTYTNTYDKGKTYEDDEKVFLLSMKEMSFSINTNEGDITGLYGDYTNNTLTNGEVADRAKYNKAGGSLNSYRWSRSAYADNANNARYVTSTGTSNRFNAFDAYYYAPAFIFGKKAVNS